MAGIQLGGLFTGIDTKTLIQQLIAAEQGRVNRYKLQQKTWSDRGTALNDLQTKLSALRSAVGALSNADDLKAFTMGSSDTDLLTAEASNSAFEGNHTIVIHQLANAERWVHTAGKEFAEDLVGAGTFIYSYNHQETVLTTTAETTLNDLVGLINNDANNPGVTANILYYNDAYHLMLNGKDAGSDYAISINASNTEVCEATSAWQKGTENAVLADKIVDLEQFDGVLVGGESITISGKRHDGTVVSQNVAITNNTTLNQLVQKINDAFGGTATATLENGEIRLTDNTSGMSQMTLSLTYDPGAGSTTLDTPIISSGNKEVWQAGTALTAGGQTAVLADTLVALDGFGGTLVGDESITISGKRHDGTAVNQSLSINANTTLDQLLQEINVAFGGTATATLEEGRIRLTDYASGTSQMELTLTYQPGSGSTTLSLPLLSESVHGETITANLAGFSAANFTRTQSAQDSQIKVDGYPAGADEWITRSSNTVDDIIHGVTLHLHDTGTVQVDLTRDTQSVRNKLNSIISAYNAAIALYQEKTGYNATTKTAGVLMGDLTTSDMTDDLRLPLLERAAGFTAGVDSFTLPSDIGLKLDGDGKLSLDSNVFDQAIADDYMGVLAVIGAAKTGGSDSNTIQFYGASSKYTMAGTYDVQVTIAGGIVTSAKIKLAGEDAYRDATCVGATVTGNATFDEKGDPLHPENGLQLSIDRSQDGTFTAQVHVKQGFAGAMTEALERMLNTATGTLPASRKNMDEHIQHLQEQIDTETARLQQRQTALVAKFARLESTLALLQNQMAALGMNTGTSNS